MSNQVLNQTTIKINNTFFDIVEGSFKWKKGHGETEVTTTIGEAGKVKNYYSEKPSTKRASGSFAIINTQDNQDKIDDLIPLKGTLTIEALDPNGDYVPVTNAAIINDPEWMSGTDGVEISWTGDRTIGV